MHQKARLRSVFRTPNVKHHVCHDCIIHPSAYISLIFVFYPPAERKTPEKKKREWKITDDPGVHASSVRSEQPPTKTTVYGLQQHVDTTGGGRRQSLEPRSDWMPRGRLFSPRSQSEKRFLNTVREAVC